MLAAENTGAPDDQRLSGAAPVGALVCLQVLRSLRARAGTELGTVAIDGTKLKANASRHKAMSYERMLQAEAELNAQIKALLDKAECTDEAERHEPELDLPAEIKRREDRLQAIVEAKAQARSAPAQEPMRRVAGARG